MKKKFSLLLPALCIAAIVHAQNITVPSAVKTAFAAKFPGATSVKWSMEKAKEYEAEFKLNNTDISANFKSNGSWVETETTIPANELPAAVTRAVNAKYPGAVFLKTEKIEKPGGIILYEVNIKANGKKKELELKPDGSFQK